MGKNKLKKFSDLENFRNTVQAPYRQNTIDKHELWGQWNAHFFKNDQPIVLELGCGKGEYTIGLAELDPSKNYIGVDIKGARLWQGAKYATDSNLDNVGFLRTSIELIHLFFAPNEVSEIWLTFPDPQMKRARKRLTSTRFIKLYRRILKPGGLIHLKTDSNFQFQYTEAVIEANGFEMRSKLDDVYAQDPVAPVLQIKTYYENQWMERGIRIKFISFVPHWNDLIEPDVEIEPDTYRSFGRGIVTDD